MIAPTLSASLLSFSTDERGDWAPLRSMARTADVAGLDRLALSDHVVFGEHLDAYSDPKTGGSRGGRQPTGPDGAWLDPLATIAHLSAITTQVRFATSILIAALRRPVVLAKTAATIDVLSGGRLDLGVGVGWQREEYEAAGLAFESRGATLDRTLAVCRALWRERRASHDDLELRFEAIHQMPKPLQPGGVPIWVSGTVQPRSMDRLARFGDGWIPWGDDADDIGAGISRMRAAVAERDRDPAEIGVVGRLKVAHHEDRTVDLDQTLAAVPELRQAGVTDFRLAISIPSAEQEALDTLAPIVAAFRAATS